MHHNNKKIPRILLIAVDLCLILLCIVFAKNVVSVSSSNYLPKSITDTQITPFEKISPIPIASIVEQNRYLLEEIKKEASKITSTSETKNYSENTTHLLTLINTERNKTGLPNLSLDQNLSTLALKHSTDMSTRNFFSHVNPDNKDPFQRLKDFSIDFQTAGENIAYAPDIDTAHKNLMNSPKHRDNILSSSYTKIGIGVFVESKSKILITEVFTN